MTQPDSPPFFSRASLTLFIVVALACIAGAVGGVVAAGMFASSWIPDEPANGRRRKSPPHKLYLEVIGNGKPLTSLAVEPTTERLVTDEGE